MLLLKRCVSVLILLLVWTVIVYGVLSIPLPVSPEGYLP
jgi:hypothetical protein